MRVREHRARKKARKQRENSIVLLQQLSPLKLARFPLAH
jgi:hypothetical protein